MGHGFRDQRETGGVMPGVFMNPGTENIEGAKSYQATINLGKLLKDIGLGERAHWEPASKDMGGGRFSYLVTFEGRSCEIDMPGLPLEQVRYTNAAGQNIWDFPRMYVNGSSWVWCYALPIVREALLGDSQDKQEGA